MAKRYKTIKKPVISWKLKVGDKIFYRHKDIPAKREWDKHGKKLVESWSKAKVFMIRPHKVSVITSKGSSVDLYRDTHLIKVYARLERTKKKRKKKSNK